LKPQKRSSKCSIVNRTVSFNTEDPYQVELLEKSYNMVNFSASVKRWLAEASSVTAKTHENIPIIISAPSQPVPVHEPVPGFDPVTALF
jgi:hypothetical protein